jgi:catechol 2,3-dioxygenase-like lactoylglutathione lyase family enzyme
MAEAPSLTFSHCGVFVTDLDRMVDFYTRVLGFVVSDRGKVGALEFAFLTRDPREHHQIVMATGRPPGTFNTVQQISFRLDSLGTLRKMWAALQKEHGLITLEGPALGPISHAIALSVYFADPEGNRIELFIDTPWAITQPTRFPLDLSLSDDDLWQEIEAHARRQPGFRPIEEFQAEIAKKLADRLDQYA